MKKFTLSSFVILIFIFYVLEQKSQTSTKPTAPVDSLQASSQTTITPSQQVSSSTQKPSARTYRDGQYLGNVTDAFYGPMQVSITISAGKISDIAFVQYPNDRPTSRMINNQAMPTLKQEAIAAQNASVDIVTGATQSSEAFRESLRSALIKAS